MIRREKCEIMKLNKSPLPPKVDIIIWVMITHLQKGIYNSLIELYMNEKSNHAIVFHLMAMIFALLDHPYLVYFSVKNTLAGSIGDYRHEIDKNC